MNNIWTIPLTRTNELILKLLDFICFRFHGMSQLMSTKTKNNFYMSLAWLKGDPAKTPNFLASTWVLRPELVAKQARGGQ